MFYEKNRIYGTTKVYTVSQLRQAFQDPRADFIKTALLFGSRALGKAHSKSDYDFALVMEDDGNAPWGLKAKAYNTIEDILKLDACDIDIVDLETADSVVLQSIEEGYIVLKGDKNDISGLPG